MASKYIFWTNAWIIRKHGNRVALELEWEWERTRGTRRSTAKQRRLPAVDLCDPWPRGEDRAASTYIHTLVRIVRSGWA